MTTTTEDIRKKIKIGDLVSYNLKDDIIFGTQEKNMLLLEIMNFNSAIIEDEFIESKTNRYNYKTSSLIRARETIYYLFRDVISGEKKVVSLEWFDAKTVYIQENSTLKLTITDTTSERLLQIKDFFDALGVRYDVLKNGTVYTEDQLASIKYDDNLSHSDLMDSLKPDDIIRFTTVNMRILRDKFDNMRIKFISNADIAKKHRDVYSVNTRLEMTLGGKYDTNSMEFLSLENIYTNDKTIMAKDWIRVDSVKKIVLQEVVINLNQIEKQDLQSTVAFLNNNFLIYNIK